MRSVEDPCLLWLPSDPRGRLGHNRSVKSQQTGQNKVIEVSLPEKAHKKIKGRSRKRGNPSIQQKSKHCRNTCQHIRKKI
jgi:hypothetical protein